MEKNELKKKVNYIIYCFICFDKVFKSYMCTE